MGPQIAQGSATRSPQVIHSVHVKPQAANNLETSPPLPHGRVKSVTPIAIAALGPRIAPCPRIRYQNGSIFFRKSVKPWQRIPPSGLQTCDCYCNCLRLLGPQLTPGSATKKPQFRIRIQANIILAAYFRIPPRGLGTLSPVAIVALGPQIVPRSAIGRP